MPSIEQLRDEYAFATAELNRINDMMRAAIAAESRRIKEAYRERIEAASTASVAASRALREAEDAVIAAKAASHPLVGRKVTAVRKKRNSPWARDMEQTYGVIEVITADSEQPSRSRGYYSKLERGTVAVRFLNPAGKPLKTVERLVLRDDKRKQMLADSQQWTEEQREKILERYWQLV